LGADIQSGGKDRTEFQEVEITLPPIPRLTNRRAPAAPLYRLQREAFFKGVAVGCRTVADGTGSPFSPPDQAQRTNRDIEHLPYHNSAFPQKNALQYFYS